MPKFSFSLLGLRVNIISRLFFRWEISGLYSNVLELDSNTERGRVVPSPWIYAARRTALSVVLVSVADACRVDIGQC